MARTETPLVSLVSARIAGALALLSAALLCVALAPAAAYADGDGDQKAQLRVTVVVTSAPENGTSYDIGETIRWDIIVSNIGDLALTDVNMDISLDNATGSPMLAAGSDYKVRGQKAVISNLPSGGLLTIPVSYSALETDSGAAIGCRANASALNPVAPVDSNGASDPVLITPKASPTPAPSPMPEPISISEPEPQAGDEDTAEDGRALAAEREQDAPEPVSKSAIPATGDDLGKVVIPISVAAGVALVALIGAAVKRREA